MKPAIVEADLADKLHNTAPRLAAEISKLTKCTWTYQGERVSGPNAAWPGQPIPSFRLVHDKFAVSVCGEARTARVTCSPMLPKAPNGTPHGQQLYMSDVLPYSVVNGKRTQAERPEASVGLARFLARPEVIAAEFLRKVITPYLAMYPEIQAHIDRRGAGFAARDAAVADLVKWFNGRVSENSSGGSVMLYFPHLPLLTVAEGGRITFNRSPSFSLETMKVLLPLLAAEKE